MMSFMVGNRKRFIVTIVVLCTTFILTMIWSVYAYQFMSNRDYESRQSWVISEQYRMLYENDRRAIMSTEILLDAAMQRTLKDVSKDLLQQDKIDVNYLKRLTAEYAITGIWLIEGDKVVHLSSEGEKHTDVTQWYKDRPDLKWSEKLDWLLNTRGAIWIDGFSKRNTPPHQYLKWGYMGLGEVPQLGGQRVILEIGLSIEDAMSANKLENIMSNSNLVSKSIVRSTVEFADPQKPAKKIVEKQVQNGNQFTTTIAVKDFNNQETKVTIVTQFPSVDSTTRGTLIICIGSTIFTLLCFGLLLVGLIKRPRH
jgi:hypothetical protein